MNFSYETVGNSSYLVATFEGGAGIVNYQLQMLTNNEIKNIISANKRRKNDDILVSYNITSKISLGQLDNMNKIPKVGLINIIEGALDAIADIQEYQLVSSGIVFDEDYIFIKPGSFEPSFVYIPASTDDVGIEPLKRLVVSLIMGSKVEMTNDNFVQVLLETLNNPVMTADDLKKFCIKFKSGEMNIGNKEKIAEEKKLSEKKVIVEDKNARNESVINTEAKAEAENIGDRASVDIPGRATIGTTTQKQEVRISKQKQETECEGKTNEKKMDLKKILFIALQAVLAVVTIVVVASGVLTDATGKLNISYLGGVVLAVACVDFVIYREMFVNNKEKDSGKVTKKAESKIKATTKPSTISIPGKSTPLIPGKSKSVKDSASSSNEVFSNVATQSSGSVQIQEEHNSISHIPEAAYIPNANSAGQFVSSLDFESEDTIVMADNNSNSPHLEYYDNGLLTRFDLNKEFVVVGKLRSQCDYIIENNKISKMHAEFILRNGEYFVKDFNSTNGTYINGASERIQSNVEYKINNGDRITLANVDLTFKC